MTDYPSSRPTPADDMPAMPRGYYNTRNLMPWRNRHPYLIAALKLAGWMVLAAWALSAWMVTR